MHAPAEFTAELHQALALLNAGQLLGLPTETVYGLAADADNDQAVARIYELKQRPLDHPLIVHVANAEQAQHYAQDIPPYAKTLMQTFWPGPLSLVFKRRQGKAGVAAAGQATVALRCPAHPLAQQLLKAFGRGVAAPSANRFGRVSPTTAAHVHDEFGADLYVLDGGPCVVGIESTIVDCSRAQPVLLRPGMITNSQMQDVLGQPILQRDDHAPKASGTLEAHYAPLAKVQLMQAQALQQALKKSAASTEQKIWIYAPGAAPLDLPPQVHWQRMPLQAQACAQELFAVLRRADDEGAQAIWIQTPDDSQTEDWTGVMDRLTRAAAA